MSEEKKILVVGAGDVGTVAQVANIGGDRIAEQIVQSAGEQHREQAKRYEAAFKAACEAHRVDYGAAMFYRQKIKNAILLVGLSKSKKDAEMAWKRVHKAVGKAKKRLGISILAGTPAEVVIREKEKMPLIYDACKKWGLI